MNSKSWLLEKNFDRFDSYIERADNKGSLILGFSGALLSFLLLEGNKLLTESCSKKILILIASICLVISIGLCILTIFPRKGDRSIISCFFYESIAHQDISAYKNNVTNAVNDELVEEMFVQTRELAKICSKKMFFVRWAVICLGIALGLLFIAFIGIYT